MAKPRVRHEVSQPLDQSYRLIPLTQGQNAIVDVEDFESLSKYHWYAEWCPGTKSFYAVRKSPVRNGYRKTLRMHRIVLRCRRREQGDHRNHDTLDNRRQNLRRCSFSQNRQNSKPWKPSAVGFRGVKKECHRFSASIKHNRKARYLGCYKTAEAAAFAYDETAKVLFGEFAQLNFPPKHRPH
jgi:hypothetical protein